MAVYEKYNNIVGPKKGGPYLDELELLEEEKVRAGREKREPKYDQLEGFFYPSSSPVSDNEESLSLDFGGINE
jgi:hypothetical protein